MLDVVQCGHERKPCPLYIPPYLATISFHRYPFTCCLLLSRMRQSYPSCVHYRDRDVASHSESTTSTHETLQLPGVLRLHSVPRAGGARYQRVLAVRISVHLGKRESPCSFRNTWALTSCTQPSPCISSSPTRWMSGSKREILLDFDLGASTNKKPSLPD